MMQLSHFLFFKLSPICILKIYDIIKLDCYVIELLALLLCPSAYDNCPRIASKRPPLDLKITPELKDNSNKLIITIGLIRTLYEPSSYNRNLSHRAIRRNLKVLIERM